VLAVFSFPSTYANEGPLWGTAALRGDRQTCISTGRLGKEKSWPQQLKQQKHELVGPLKVKQLPHGGLSWGFSQVWIWSLATMTSLIMYLLFSLLSSSN